MINNNAKLLLSEAKWIWPDINFFDLLNTYAHFRKDFELKSVPSEVQLYITADHSYRLWINGKYVTRGPARGYQSHWPYDELDVSEYLVKGKNYISVEVYNPGISTFSYITQTIAGFLCAGDFGDFKLRSDSSWISRSDSSHKKDTARYSLQLAFQEHVDTRSDDRKWITSSKSPTGWSKPNETNFGSMPWHDVEAREIPQLRETLRNPVKFIAQASGKVKKGYQSWRNITGEMFHEMVDTKWSGYDASLENNAPIIFPVSGKGNFSAFIVDMGETVVGPATLKVSGGKPGNTIDLFFSEVINNNFSPFFEHPDSYHCRMSMSNRLILSGKNVEHNFYHILGFRYITVVARENTSYLSVNIEIADTGYPYSMAGSFECSDKDLNDIWKICRRTEQVCSLDAYVDTPWREQAQWWGDARIQFWNTMAMDGDTRLFRRGIKSIAGQSVPNGLTYGHAPTMAHGCILPDFSLVWLTTIFDYYKQTKDITLFNEMLPRINEVLSYFENEAVKQNGLLCYDDRYWLFLDWSNLVMEGSPTLYNMWYLLALKALVHLYEASGDSKEADKLRKKANALQSAIEKYLFDSNEGLFCDGLDNSGVPYKKYSVHSQTFAILLDLKPEYHDSFLTLRILPFLKGEKLSDSIPSTYWTSYVMDAASKKGYSKEAIEYIKSTWTPIISYSTCPELIGTQDANSSCSHAWSAHPLYLLMNILGGVHQDSDGWETITYSPYFAPELDFVDVKYPTPHGLIESSWKRVADKVKVSLRLPDGVRAKIRIPGQEKEVSRSFET